MYTIGEIVHLEGNPAGSFPDGLDCEVVQISEDGLRPTKLKACIPDEKLGRIGFIEENGQYYAIEWEWSPN